jgi:hypothetical protein
MANSIDYVTTFLALIDEIYKLESVTAPLDAITQDSPDFNGKATVKVMKLSTVGLGTYSRATGYPAGDVTATWEAMLLACERGRSFSIDRMDNDESLGLMLGNLIRTWMKEKVAPEIDAYRFAKYASTASIQAATPGTLSSATILAAIDAAALALDEKEVPSEGRMLYISSTCKRYLESAVTRVLSTEGSVDRRLRMLDDMTIVGVPQARFYTAITLNAGATGSAGGFIKNVASGKDLNFMLLHPSAVLQATKLNQVKYFAPEVNQQSDGHLWQYRLYHDAFVMDNKLDGVYIHNKA